MNGFVDAEGASGGVVGKSLSSEEGLSLEKRGRRAEASRRWSRGERFPAQGGGAQAKPPGGTSLGWPGGERKGAVGTPVGAGVRPRHTGLWRGALAPVLPVGRGLPRCSPLARCGPSTPGLGPGRPGLRFQGSALPHWRDLVCFLAHRLFPHLNTDPVGTQPSSIRPTAVPPAPSWAWHTADAGNYRTAASRFSIVA